MFNAQSIRSKFDEFKCYVALENPDVICVTETWVSEEFNGDRLQDFDLEGYNMFSYCRSTRQGGGVFLYVKSLYSVTEVSDSSKAGAVESVWVDIKVGMGVKNLLRLGAFYRAGNLLRDCQAEMDQDICEEIRRNSCKQCLIMGDFNLREYVTCEDSNECKVFRHLFEEELFMNQFVSQPTRQSSTLDLIFADSRDLVTDVRVGMGLGSSDHNMVLFSISSVMRPKDNLLLVPNFNLADFDSMRHELASINWSRELKSLDALEAWKFFKHRLAETQNRHVPLRHKRSRPKKNPVWLTSEVKSAIQEKKDCFQ